MRVQLQQVLLNLFNNALEARKRLAAAMERRRMLKAA
jgi:C4-dicarboxylate-specific signal transduction histidine kinase